MDAWLRWIPGVRGEREREEGTGGGVQKYQEEIAKLATQRNFLSLPLVAKANRKQCSDRSMNLPPWPWERRMDECMARLAPASSDPMQLLAGGAINIYISQICQWIIRLVSFSDACVVCTATLRARSRPRRQQEPYRLERVRYTGWDTLLPQLDCICELIKLAPPTWELGQVLWTSKHNLLGAT